MYEPDSHSACSRRIPLAAWPSLLSLDAVFVALAWQQLMMRSFCHRSSTWPEIGSLTATVWLIYVADRLLDASKLNLRRPHTLRHRFFRSHARLFVVLWIAVLVGDSTIVVFYLPTELMRSGLMLASVVLVYGASVHLGPKRPTTRARDESTRRGWFHIPKEIRVGALFALGVSLTTWTQLSANAPVASQSFPATGPLGTLVCATCALAALFSCNCILVARFERRFDRAQAFDSIAAGQERSQFRRTHWHGLSAQVIVYATLSPLLVRYLPMSVFFAVAASAISLSLAVLLPSSLWTASTLYNSYAAFDIRSVWVDAVLWTPPVVMLWLM